MKKIVFLLLFIFPICVHAIETSAKCAILLDTDNNTILYEKNVDEIRSVASISKIMTAILAIESGKLDDVVTVGSEVNEAYGSGIYIRENEKLTLRDLVYGLMLRSGNDAALVIAKYVGGSVDNFVKLMNEKAQKLKMNNTTFNNPSGLDMNGGNLSTAYDMALLTSYAMKNAEYRKVTSTKKYKLVTNKNTYLWINKNKLLNMYKYTTGGKTGFTEKAKRTLVSTASKNNMNLVVVTLNDGNDWQDHQKLFNYGFDNFTKVELLSRGDIKIYDDTYYDQYNFYIKNNFSYIVNNLDKKSILFKYKIEKLKKVTNDSIIGKLIIYIGDNIIHTEPIYVKEKKSKKNNSILEKIKDWVLNLW